MNRQIARASGFTLIELMIVVVIVGILLLVALPGYERQTIKTKRALGKGELMGVMARQEQYFVNNRRYATTLADLGFTNPYSIDADGNRVAVNSADEIYTIAISGASATAFTLTATPKKGQAKDTLCGTLQITSTGVKSESGTSNVKECW